MTESDTPGMQAGEDRVRARRYMSSTAKHGGIYAFGVILSRLTGFLMLPVYTRVLTAADYGVLEIISLSTDVVGMLAGLGLGAALTRHYFLRDTDEARNRLVSTAALLAIGAFTTVALIGLVFSSSIASVLLGPDQPAKLVQLAVTGLLLTVLADIPIVVLRTRQQSATVVTVSMTRLLLSLSLNILFVVYLRLGVEGVLYSNILSAATVGGYLSFAMFRRTAVHFSPRVARDLLLFGAPLMASQIGSFVLHFSDRYFLRIYTSLSVVGLYSLSYKFAMLLSVIVVGPFFQIWIPKALEIDRREGERSGPILAEILRYYSLILVTAALSIALFSSDIIGIVAGPSFREAHREVPVLALAMVFFGLRQVAQLGSLIAQKPRVLAISTTFAAASVLGLNLLFIPRWGAMGAAVATLMGFAGEFFLTRYLSSRVHPVRIALAPLFRPLLIAIVAWFAAHLLAADRGHVVSVGIRLSVLTGYLIALVALGIVTRDHLRLIAKAVRDPRGAIRALKGA